LVTGGAGFIGSHLADALVHQGIAVRLLDDLSTGTFDRPGRRDAGGPECVEGDVRDAAAVRAALDGIDTVFHLAARCSVAASVERPHDVDEHNVGGTLTVLQAAAELGVRRVVLASSAAVYGELDSQPARESDPPHPTSPYGASKVAAEAYAAAFAASRALDTVSLRFFNVYGPRQTLQSDYAAVVPAFIDAALAGRALSLFGDGEQTRDFCFVQDVVKACLQAAQRAAPFSGCAYNVGSGGACSVNGLAETLGNVLGKKLDREQRPTRAGEVRHCRADTTRATQQLGFRASVPLADGLKATLDWWEKQR
jgi:UDP-glucose 4-epimerase